MYDTSNQLSWKDEHCSEGFNTDGGQGVTCGSVANCINKEYMAWYLLYPIDSFLHMSDSCWVNLGMWPLKSIALEKWPKTCTLNLQLLHNTKRPRKWSGHMKMIDPPNRNFYIGMTQCYQAFYLFNIATIRSKYPFLEWGFSTVWLTGGILQLMRN